MKIWFPTREQIERASPEEFIRIVQYATRLMRALSGKAAALALLLALLLPVVAEAQGPVITAIESDGCLICQTGDTIGARLAVSGPPEGAAVNIYVRIDGPNGRTEYGLFSYAIEGVTRVPLFSDIPADSVTVGVYTVTTFVTNAAVLVPPSGRFLEVAAQTFWVVE